MRCVGTAGAAQDTSNEEAALARVDRAMRELMTAAAAWLAGVRLQTPDGAWRVEVVRRGHTHWYRIVHGESQIDWLSIAAVERILGEAGIEMADLVQITAPPSEHSNGT